MQKRKSYVSSRTSLLVCSLHGQTTAADYIARATASEATSKDLVIENEDIAAN
jgi:hypothetical protein